MQNRYFILLFEPGRKDRSRLGITVTRKFGNAVARNRMKRLCRECFRLHRGQIQGTWDISLIVKNSAAEIGGTMARESLKQLFKKLD